MTNDFLEFHNLLSNLIKSFDEKNVLIKMQSDPDTNFIRIFGEKCDSVALARNGLDEITELAYTTVEHHPYWSLLYNGSQILKIVLEKWNETITEEELKEISWYADEIKNSTGNIVKNHSSE